jgi:hypothetical protein
MSYRKRLKRKLFNKYGLIFSSVIIFINIAAIGYGSWQKDLKIINVISTGSIDPVFSSCEIVEDRTIIEDRIPEANPEESVDSGTEMEATEIEGSTVEITNGGKSMYICINGAYLGYSADINYTIKNNGSIPVICTINTPSTDLIIVDIEESEMYINGNGGSNYGCIKVIINDIPEEFDVEQEYSLTVDMNFRQYNIIE